VPKLSKTVIVEAPVEKVFSYVDEPANLPEIWPGLFEVKDVETFPDGGYRFAWFYNLAGKRIEGHTATYERIVNKRLVEKAEGDMKSTFTWIFHGENGRTKIDFEADYELPKTLFAKEDEPFVMRTNEYEAETVLANLKTKLEL
jgi:uncharacterized protein YndB with AHSA1/START domain